MNRRILTLACAVALGALGAGCPGGDCALNSDCADGEQCVDKVCQKPTSACSPSCGGGTPVCDEATGTCKVCTTGKGCPSGKTCDTVVPQGACVDCLSSANCPGSAPVCADDRTCVACTESEGCEASEQCDTSVAGGRCVPTGCTVTADCKPTPATPICDATQRKCVVCTAAAGCAPGTNCIAGECTGCTADIQCPPATPACETTARRCVTCTATSGCPSGKRCDLTVAGGRCVDSAGTCSGDGECAATPATPKCDTAAKRCVAVCTATGGCSAPQVCDTSVTGGRCVDCRASADCSGGKVCDTAQQKCVTCLASNEGCTGGKVCDTGAAGGLCVGCLGNSNCSGATPVCDTAAKTCVGCLLDASCTGQGKVCDTAQKACVTCTAAKGCTSPQVCDVTVTGGACVTPADCTSSAQCAGKPGTPVCDLSKGKCVACLGTNEGCSGGKVCDTSVAGGACVECLLDGTCSSQGKVCGDQKTCVTCTATKGCVSPQVCDTGVAGGACVACTSNSHCGGATPVCDTAAKVCVGCTSNSNCGGATPVCDTSAKVCVGCLVDATCTSQGKVCDTAKKTCATCTATKGCTSPQVCDLGVTGGQCITPVDCTSNTQCASKPSTPVCDLATNKCVACTATQGCATGVCDTSVAGGRCVDCTSSTHCAAAGKVCNTSTKTCVTCLGTNEGCLSGKVCDTNVVGGACVECVGDSNCTGGKVCSPSQTCVTCTAAKGCTGGKVCDLNVAGGACVGCLSSVHCAATPATPVCNMTTKACVTCTATEGCTNQGKVCDTGVAGGACVECTLDGHCTGGKVCSAQKTCVTCTAAKGCTAPQVCDTGVAGGACVGCLGNPDCGGATPICNTTTKTCVTCTATQGCLSPMTCNTSVPGGQCTGCASSANCAAPTPACNTTTHQCVACTATEGCSGATPKCKTAVPVCVQCLGDTDCPGGTCNLTTNTCTTSVDVSQQIAAARSVADGAGLALPITGAYVTLVRAQHGTGDPAGFFIQGSATGPALFVSDLVNAVPAPAAGDKVSFTITEMASSATLRLAKTISGYTRVSQGNLSAVNALQQNVSSKTDLVSALGDYESEYVSASGTVGASAYGGNGFSKFAFATTGMPTGLNLRVPLTVTSGLGLVEGCVLTLNKGVMWRFNADAQITGYSSADFTVSSCPAQPPPQVISASPISATSLVVNFSKPIDPATVLANGTQFTFTGGLSALAATASGSSATVTTTAMGVGSSYTVTVASTVKDALGVGIDAAAKSASFVGPGGGCSPKVVISQVFTGGGSATPTYKFDFVELHNRSATAQPLGGWSLQYASATGTFTAKIDLDPLKSIPAGGYYLIQTSSPASATGLDLPTPDQIGTSINIQVANAKLALVNGTTLVTACTDATILDLIGFGTANCFEGTVLGALSQTTAAVRNGNGCTDSGNNSTDFTVGTAAPRNSASAALTCGCD